MLDHREWTPTIRRVPVLGRTLSSAARVVRRRAFPSSAAYWERHYAAGGGSGEGSEGSYARFKARVLNGFVAANAVRSVVEFGCGDGQQLSLATYPRYLGLDVSATTLRRTMGRFRDDPDKSFLLYRPDCYGDAAGWISADLALSLDVIYHLVEDDVYRLHLRHVFGTADRFVALFTSDLDTLTVSEHTSAHVRHRRVAHDVARDFPDWRLRERIPNDAPYGGAGTETSFADFLIYERPPS